MAVLFNGGIASNGTAVLAPETVEAILTEHWTYDGSNGNNYYNLFNSWGWGSSASPTPPWATSSSRN